MSPSDSSVGFFTSLSGAMHVTTDRFTSFVNKASMGLKRYALHPTEAEWLLATNSKHELLLSQDLGSTWKSIANRVFDFAWGRAAGESWGKESVVAVMLDDAAPVPPSDVLTKTLSLYACLSPPLLP